MIGLYQWENYKPRKNNENFYEHNFLEVVQEIMGSDWFHSI